ncbi:MAG: hypothetical protein KF696_01285 [Planctomycetes bacterium]|nr:hypothetical protein [Planctomycetota bacterium]MCW8134427.1 hypothetical protein [Planctomycetota bacterium]
MVETTVASRHNQRGGSGDVSPASGTTRAHDKLIAALRPTIVYDTYWRFAYERQEIFFRRLARSEGPWTADEVLLRHKFTNAYRATDRVSQYLIRRVIYEGDQSPEEVFFRVILFKLFNKIETWELLSRTLGVLTWKDYSFVRYEEVLSKARENNERIYSAAYIMPSAATAFGSRVKHQNHLRLVERMMESRLPDRLGNAPSMSSAFHLLLEYPSIGPFLAYQYVIDINYSSVTNFSENDFVVAGPGAKDGIRKCFADTRGYTDSEIIRIVCERQDSEFARLGLAFRTLWGRQLQLIDCQNLFCEVDKYARVVHPEHRGCTGRSRIKQIFRPKNTALSPWFPPKWNLNNLLQQTPRPVGKRPLGRNLSLDATW